MNWQEEIRACQRLRKPFVLFRTPGSNKFEGWFSRELSHFQTAEDSGFVFAPFALGERLFLNSDRCEKFEFDTPAGPMPDMPVAPCLPDVSGQPYTQKVARAVGEMQSGKFDKVVLSRTETVGIDAHSYADYFERLLVLYPQAMVYLWYHPVSGVWMGATPETLLRYQDRALFTMALAGTRAFELGVSPVFTHKEREEQQIVTDFIVCQLRRITPEVNCSDTYQVRAGNLWHLRTDISAVLPEGNLDEAVALLHPTPAVCGMPKEIAREYILENEGYNRSYYSGYFGLWKYKGKTDLYVNLRCAALVQNQASLFMGCGITAQSIPENEYVETINKSVTMRRALADKQ